MSQNAGPSTAALTEKRKANWSQTCRREGWQRRLVSCSGNSESQAVTLTSPSLLSLPCSGRGVIPFGAEPRSRTSEHSWVDFHCPTVKSCFLPPLISISISSSSLAAFPSSHPPFLPSTQKTRVIKIGCCLLLLPCSFFLHVVTFLLWSSWLFAFYTSLFMLLTMDLWPLECYPNK